MKSPGMIELQTVLRYQMETPSGEHNDPSDYLLNGRVEIIGRTSDATCKLRLGFFKFTLIRVSLAINVVEIKFSQGPFTITKSYAEELRRKLAVFRGASGTRKNVFLTFLTTHGLAENVYAKELAQVSLSTDALFAGMP